MDHIPTVEDMLLEQLCKEMQETSEYYERRALGIDRALEWVKEHGDEEVLLRLSDATRIFGDMLSGSAACEVLRMMRDHFRARATVARNQLQKLREQGK